MRAIDLGTNTIEDCEVPIAVAGQPLFDYSVRHSEVCVSFTLHAPPASTSIRVVDNRVEEGAVEVFLRPDGLDIVLDGRQLFGIDLGTPRDRVSIDLRPVGLDVHTDDRSLLIGGSVLSGNRIKHCATAIAIDRVSADDC